MTQEEIMTQEEKELMIKDLCGRLPYGVKVMHILRSEYYDVLSIDAERGDVYVKNHKGQEEKYCVESIIPILRPMRSMTAYEDEKWWESFHREQTLVAEHSNSIDWLNKNHFDYRGLIPMGLALEDKEGMYNN